MGEQDDRAEGSGGDVSPVLSIGPYPPSASDTPTSSADYDPIAAVADLQKMDTDQIRFAPMPFIIERASECFGERWSLFFWEGGGV